MRCLERSLLAEVVPVTVYYLLVFAKTSFKRSILSDVKFGVVTFLFTIYPRGIEPQRRPLTDEYLSLLRALPQVQHPRTRPWCSPGVWLYSLDEQLTAVPCRHLVFS